MIRLKTWHVALKSHQQQRELQDESRGSDYEMLQDCVAITAHNFVHSPSEGCSFQPGLLLLLCEGWTCSSPGSISPAPHHLHPRWSSLWRSEQRGQESGFRRGSSVGSEGQKLLTCRKWAGWGTPPSLQTCTKILLTLSMRLVNCEYWKNPKSIMMIRYATTLFRVICH